MFKIAVFKKVVLKKDDGQKASGLEGWCQPTSPELQILKIPDI